MYLFKRISAVLCAVFALMGGGSSLQAQSAGAVAQTQRVFGDVETGSVTRIGGHVPAWASAANDLGSVASSRNLDNLHLVLARSAPVEAAFEQLLADQQNPASARYHQWLTPQQNADQYGIAAADVAAVTDWMKSRGLSVDGVAGGGLFITFSGPVSVVESAFSTHLHTFMHEGSARFAPTAEPAVPAALAGVIQAVAGLTEQMAHVQSRAGAIAAGGEVQPLYNTSSGNHFLSPGDFNAIYNINPTLNAGINGSGMRVVNLIDSRIAAADITGFNSVFGMSVAQPNQILVPGGTDPGLSSGSEGEAALDVQRILGTAPGAAVDLLVMGSLSFNNIYSALQYEVGTLNDPIVNMSFGACNSGNSTSQSQAFDSYFKTGAAQGISFFVSSGDQAAAGCDSGSTIPAAQVLATNLICASSYATCVGGTQFAEGSGSYWAGSNSSTRVSATGHIPEGAWDEPTFVSSGKTSYQASGTGGGVTNFAKPSWQAGVGVPADGFRDVPDVSFTSSFHDGYLVCQADSGNDCSAGTFKYITFGTSASSPAMAGIAALLDQKLGARQGNLNPLFYTLAATPSNGVFHDVTVASSGVASCSTDVPSICNNSTPSSTALTGGLAGYAVGNGYDLATGLGSLDVTNFLAAAAPATTVSPATTKLAISASANPITTAQTVTFAAALTGASGATGTVQFYSNGSALGSAVALSTAGTATTAALGFAGAGSYAITAVYSGDASFAGSTSSALALVVTSPAVPSFTLSAASGSLSFASGAITGNVDSISVSSVNGFAGTVALSCSVTPASTSDQVGCAITPTGVVVGAGGSGAAAATISTTAQTSAAHTALAGAAFVLLVLAAPFRRRRGVRSLAGVVAVFSVLAVISGCGSGGALTSPATTASSARSYTVTVTGTGTSAGSSAVVTASTVFSVTVN